MATWKCTNCGWDNAGKWETCAKCGLPKNATPEQLRSLQEEKERHENFLLTTTPVIEGMTITRYIGILTGVAVLGTGFYSEFTGGIADMFGTRATAFQNKLEEARSAAVRDLVRLAIQRGADAVVGVDLDYMEIGANLLVVSANGTGVKAEKSGANH